MIKNIAIVVCLMFIVACVPSQEEETVKIGVIAPLTGRLSTVGETVLRSIDLAVEEINQEGINDKKLELIFEDTKSDPKEATKAAQKLIEIDELDFILEIASSGEAAVVAPLSQESEVIHYSVLATTDSLVEAGDYVFKMREPASMHAKKIVEVMKKEGVETVAVLHSSGEFCTNIAIQFEKHVDDLDLLITEQYVPDEAFDVRSQIAKIENKNPDSIYVCGFYKDLGQVFKQLHEFDVKQKLFSVTTFEHPLVREGASEDAIEGVIYTVSPLHCEKTDFCEKFEEKYEMRPDYRAAFVYDAVYVVADALKKSTNPEELKHILLEVEFEGATGKTKFDEKGNAIKEVVVHQVKDREWSDY